MTKRKTVGWKVGNVVSIPLGGGRFAFGWLLTFPLIAFFDWAEERERPPIESLVGRPIAFRIWVMGRAVKQGMWSVIGHESPSASLLEPPTFVKSDSISGALSLTRKGSEETSATRAECLGLERAAVWDPEHVVDRLNDHFDGRPNIWVESLRLE